MSNKKKADIMDELRQLNFQAFPKVEAKTKSVADEAVEDQDELDEPTGTTTDFDYLLSMSIYSLTRERVERLLKERDETETQLKILLGRSPQNLWDEDLTAFLEEWDAKIAEDARLASMTTTKVISAPKRRRAPPKPKKEEGQASPTKKTAPKKEAPKKEAAPVPPPPTEAPVPSPLKHERVNDDEDELALPPPKTTKTASKAKATPKAKAPAKSRAKSTSASPPPPPSRRATSSRAAAKARPTYALDSDDEPQDDPNDDSVAWDGMEEEDDSDEDYYR